MIRRSRRAGLGAVVRVAAVLALAGCVSDGGDSASGNTEAAGIPATSGTGTGSGTTGQSTRLSVAAYSAQRQAVTPAAVAPAVGLAAALDLATAPLQSSLTTANGTVPLADAAIVFPGLQAARIDVLRNAAQGDTRAQLEAALPASATVDAVRAQLDGVSRRWWAGGSTAFGRAFLVATDTGGSASPSWQYTPVADWSTDVGAVSAYGVVDDLGLTAQSRLVIGQGIDIDVSLAGQANAFTGIVEGLSGTRYTAPLVAIDGVGGVWLGDDHRATATWAGGYLWVSLRPLGDLPLYTGLPAASITRALQSVWSVYGVQQGLTGRSRQVWPQQSLTLTDRSRLPSGITLPYDAVQANLGGLDGGGSFLSETGRAATLALDVIGLRASAAQAMAFTFSADNRYGNGDGGGHYGGVTTRVDLPTSEIPPPCATTQVDWRGGYLALIDSAGRLKLLASVPVASNVISRCLP